MFKILADYREENNCTRTFLRSNHISGRATGKTVAEHIINILKKHEININNCRRQAYDGASTMSSDIKGAQSYI